MNLIEVLNMLQTQIRRIEDEKQSKVKEVTTKYDAILSDLRTAYEVNSNLNDACTECGGKGTVRDYLDAHDDRGYTTKCPSCGGTGKKK